MLAKCWDEHAFLIEPRLQACKNVVVKVNGLITESVNLCTAVSGLDVHHPCFLFGLTALVHTSSSLEEHYIFISSVQPLINVIAALSP